MLITFIKDQNWNFIIFEMFFRVYNWLLDSQIDGV